ncbi:sulfotransferase family protein [Defluviicoccus vanus]|uniref:Sulfotransferase n=1 Tax=Defluviicoccus vanus TaxID=111831 RepID=A0A7H1MZT1_9PROT|nr:sulfotransferase [Defluviicoccus vanus]QNT68967.1 sulfotransferase [Defluviicoccus vanus]
MFANRSSFFIVGAPRCGTTALSKILSRHPQVLFSRPKETHLFVQDLAAMDEQFWMKQFIEPFFPHLSDQHLTFGEGSVSSLYSPAALEHILAFDPEARIIIHVRNPVDMVYSYHGRLVFLLDEDQRDFSRAWALQEERRAGRSLPKRCRDPRLLLYGDVGKLAAHVERIFARVGRERCYVVVFDDFSRSPEKLYRDVCQFLGLGQDEENHFNPKNAHRTYRNQFLHQFAVNPPPLLMRVINAANISPQQLRLRTRRLRKWLRSRNTVENHRPTLDAELRHELVTYFAPEVTRLGELLGRDLSHWQ